MMRARTLAVLVLGATCGLARADCAASVAGLQRLTGDPLFPLRWTETGMDDGKPLVLDIAERGGVLHLRFDKTQEGLWAEGSGLICAEGGSLVVRFEAGTIRPGPAAHWLLRRSLASGARFELARPVPAVLQVSTPGWRGRFAAREAAR